jgi:hypothetical protein
MMMSLMSRVKSVQVVGNHRAFSKARDKAQAFRNKFHNKVVEIDNSPKFSAMIRQLYRRSHPDLLRASHLEFSIVNDQSMQVLNGVLSAVKTYNEYPPQIVKRIPFHMKTIGADSVNCFHLNIVTAGGDSKKQITRTFQEFFVKTGISEDGQFQWDKEYFPTSLIENHVE